ncbi:MAG: two-component regulator propeller domain-containing protein, partial [Bacteroidia bacterium]
MLLHSVRFLAQSSFLCLILLGYFQVLSSQNIPSRVKVNELPTRIEQIGINEGLSQGMVNGIAEDKTGNLWIATKDGLNRYDGTSFKVFRNDPENKYSLSDNFVNCLLVDSEDRLWIGTQSHGLDLFDPLTESFTHYNKGNSGLSETFVKELTEDSEGGVVLLTSESSGYFRVLPRKKSVSILESDFIIEAAINSMPALAIANGAQLWSNNLVFGSDGKLWYYNNHVIYEIVKPFSKDEFIIRQHAHQPNLMTNVIGGNVIAISSKEANPYIIDSENVLKHYDFQTNTFLAILSLPENEAYIYSKFIDSDNRLWLIAESGKIATVNLSENKYTELSLKWYGANNEERLFHTGKFLEDAHGNIWTGTGGSGLIKISKAASRFKHCPKSQQVFSGRLSLFRTSCVQKKAAYNSNAIDDWLGLCSSGTSSIIK